MDFSYLQTLVVQGESETLEFKKTTGERRDAMHSLCAMLNHRGGRVIFGVEPKGRILGQQVSDHTIEEIAQEIQQIEPTVLTRTLDEAIRRGRMLDPGTREPMDLLRGFGLLKDGVLLRAAIVLWGKQTRLEAEFPQCLLRVARFKGNDKTAFLDNRQFNGHVFELLMRAEQFLRDNLPIAGRVVPGLFERIDEPIYPPSALREALANAFCHRDYSMGGGSVAVAIYQDRLEITSTGTLHFDLTPEKLFLPHESQPWNPLIARVFHRRGIIESWGRGTLKMAELTQQAGLPRPEIEEGPNFVLVRFRPSRYVPPQQVKRDLTDRQRLILQLLSDRPGIGRKEILTILGLELRPLKSDLGDLKRLGLIVQSGKGRGSVWHLAESAVDLQ